MDVSAPPPIGFRYPKPTDEDLPALARLAYAVSADECGTCRNYHLLWPYLRAIGANGMGVEFGWDLQRSILTRIVAGQRSVSWLIAGAADAGVTALARSMFVEEPGSTHTITVVDQCATPLALTRAYADAARFPVETVHSNLLDFTTARTFDIVLLHYVLSFLDHEGRLRLLGKISRWLAPSGRMVLFFVDRVTAPPRSPEQRRVWQRKAIEAALERGETDLPEEPSAFFRRFDGWYAQRSVGANSAAWSLRNHLDAVETAGLVVLDTIPIPISNEELEALGSVSNPRIALVCGHRQG